MLEEKKDGVALLFPGQGVQFPGMGKDLYDGLPNAKKILDTACDYLNFDLRKKIFSGTEEELRRTDMAQLAIFLVSLMYFEKWKKNNPEEEILAMAGHSLGEFTALCASGTLSFEDALELVSLRGRFMRECCLEEQGMLAVLGLEEQELVSLLSSGQLGKRISLANVNSKTQLVVAATKDELSDMESFLASKTGLKTKWLNVEGAFHSLFMEDANQKLGSYLDATKFHNPFCFVVSNFSGSASQDCVEIRDCLKNQMVSRVKWYDTILRIKELGAKAFYEVGPGETLKKICMTITFKPKCHSV